MKKYLLALLVLFFIWSSVSYATSGRTNSSWCHNSSIWYHCHNSWYDDYDDDYSSSYSETKTTVPREMSDEDIIEELKEGIKCFNITKNESDKEACKKLESEGDLYSHDEVLEELKKTKKCYKFMNFEHNNYECKELKRNVNVYTIIEIKKTTYSFNNCYKIKEFKKDYSVCLEQKKIKDSEDEEKSKVQKKIDEVNEKLVLMHSKNPSALKRLAPKFKAFMLKVEEGSDIYLILEGINKKIEELLSTEK